MTKVIFLDIDGVLNSNIYFRSYEYAEARATAQMGDDRNYGDDYKLMIDDAAVALLNEVIERTKAKIVLSSSWRLHFDLNEMQDMLNRSGFEGKLIGRTPRGMEIDPEIAGSPPMRMGVHYARGYEIQQWLVQTKHKDKFVILDDTNDFVHLTPYLVRTDPNVGLVQEDVEKLVKMLGEEDDHTGEL